MRGRRKVKRGIVLLLLFLTAGLVLRPSQAAGIQCGIWCPYCAKWQENYICTQDGVQDINRDIDMLISCKDCGNGLLHMKKAIGGGTTGSGDNESSQWYETRFVERCHADVIFPCASCYLEGGSDTDDSYRVFIDDNRYETNSYGYTDENSYWELKDYLDTLFTGLYSWAEGEFTWTQWYEYGCTTNSSGVQTSPMRVYMNWMGVKPVLQEELTPPVLTLEGEASIQIYRNGTLVSGEVKAGDTVQIIPVEAAGREYADYVISENAENVNWQADINQLSFTMPAGEVKVSIGYWTLQELSVELAPLFYETYQKEPYWNGQGFNLDCEPPITVSTDMLTVNATVQNSRTLETQKRAVNSFSIASGSEIVNLGDNPVIVRADVFQDGYIMEGSCIIRADSVSLDELMKETESQTYTELKGFVSSLMDKIASYEQIIEELSDNLQISEAQREESERKLAEALAEIESLTAKLKESEEQLGLMSTEVNTLKQQLAAMSSELAEMKATITAMQEFLQQITGDREVDEELLESAKKEFETLKEQKDELTYEIEKLESEKNKLLEENGALVEKNENLTAENGTLAEKNENLAAENGTLTEKNENLAAKNENLAEKNKTLTAENERLIEKNQSLAEKNQVLEEKNSALTGKLESIQNSNTELTKQLKNTLEEEKLIQAEYTQLKGRYDTLYGEKSALEEQITGLLEKNTGLEEKNRALETEGKDWKKKYETLLAADRSSVKLTETAGRAEKSTEKEDEKEQQAENVPVKEKETTSVEKHTTEKSQETELMTSTETVTTKKEQTDFQSAGMRTGKKLLPGIFVVMAAMLSGGVVLYFFMEKKEMAVEEDKRKTFS